jgi:hypothetical protein
VVILGRGGGSTVEIGGLRLGLDVFSMEPP